jgi:hypothetical protein
MRHFTKSLDNKKRMNKQPAVRRRSNKRVARRKSGRPKIDERQLFQDRDALLGLLSSNWERIGWRLSRARAPESLRKALSPLKRDSALSHLIANFVRTSLEKATPSQIREIAKRRGEEQKNNYAIQEKFRLLTQKYDGAETACGFAREGSRNALSAEFKKRADEFERCERDCVASNFKLIDLETKLADQRAYLAQTEVLKFKARGYAHNPKVFANAMAGLPIIGSRHSFRLCSKKDSPLWPSHRFEVFNMIRQTWENWFSDSELTITEKFRDAILRLPKQVVIEKEVIKRYNLKTKTQDNYLRAFFCENWRYLRIALEQVRVRKYRRKAVPYLITTRFFGNFGKHRTPDDLVLAEMEMIKD